MNHILTVFVCLSLVGLQVSVCVIFCASLQVKALPLHIHLTVCFVLYGCVCVSEFTCPALLPAVICVMLDSGLITNCGLSESTACSCSVSHPSSIFHPASLSHSPAFMEAINNLTLSPCLTWFQRPAEQGASGIITLNKTGVH